MRFMPAGERITKSFAAPPRGLAFCQRGPGHRLSRSPTPTNRAARAASAQGLGCVEGSAAGRHRYREVQQPHRLAPAIRATPISPRGAGA